MTAQGTKIQVNPRVLLSLDVATKYTGYAFFEKNVLSPPSFVLRGYGIVKATNKDWEARCLEMANQVGHLIHKVAPGVLVQEFPHFQAGTKGLAASRSGGTLELAYLCGRIAVVWEYYIVKVWRDTEIMLRPVHNVRYNEWAGQLTKDITCRRCEEHFKIKAKPKSIENNFADAIMLGKHFAEKYQGITTRGYAEAVREDL